FTVLIKRYMTRCSARYSASFCRSIRKTSIKGVWKVSHPYKGFEQKWVKGEFPGNSYRSIFKWGDPLEIKAPKESLYKILKDTSEFDDSYFSDNNDHLGFDEVKFYIPGKLFEEQSNSLRDIVREEFVRTDDYTRLSVAYGKTMYDIMRL